MSESDTKWLHRKSEIFNYMLYVCGTVYRWAGSLASRSTRWPSGAGSGQSSPDGVPWPPATYPSIPKRPLKHCHSPCAMALKSFRSIAPGNPRPNWQLMETQFIHRSALVEAIEMGLLLKKKEKKRQCICRTSGAHRSVYSGIKKIQDFCEIETTEENQSNRRLVWAPQP